MTRLEDIRRGLYDRAVPVPPGTPPAVPPAPPGPADGDTPPVRTAWEEPAGAAPRLMDRIYLAQLRPHRLSARTIVTLSLVALLGIAAFLGYVVFFAHTDVTFEIRGPEQLTAGEPTIVTVRMVNRGGVALKDGAVTLTLPPGAVVVGRASVPIMPTREEFAVDDIPAGGEYTREFRIQFLGPVNTPAEVSGRYLYRPENIQTQLTRQAAFSAPIVRVPVAITVDAPAEANAGEALTVTIGVDAETSVPLPALSLGIDFPSGFELKSADPAPPPATPNIWPLGELASGTSTTIVLNGVLAGDPEELKPFHVRLGRYDADAKSWLLLTETTSGPKIASPFLLAETTIGGNRQGVLEPGVRITGRVRVRNNLAEEVQNLTLTLSVPEELVALETVEVRDGFYDVTRRVLVWNPASAAALRALGPGEERTFTFSFILKSSPPIRSFLDKNFRFPIVTTVESGTPPPDFRGVALTSRDRIAFQIASHLTLAGRATYYDSPVKNTGPLPPRVRQSTTYTVFLQLGSGANDVREVSVKAALGGGVAYQGTLSTDVGTVEFNPASQELTWRVGQLAAATGLLRPHAAAVIQLVFTPAENQAGSIPPLLTAVSVSGRDSFTGADLGAQAGDVTTELRTDGRSHADEWRVVP